MKLRQRLALVLAAAMVVTAVPVVTSAKSTNELTHRVSSIDGTKVGLGDNLEVILDFSDTIRDTKTVFYINAEDFAFNKDLYNEQFTGVAGLRTITQDAFAELTKNLTTAQIESTFPAKGEKFDTTAVKAVDAAVESVKFDGKKVESVTFKVTYADKTTAEVTYKIADLEKNVSSTFGTIANGYNTNYSTAEESVAIYVANPGDADQTTSGDVRLMSKADYNKVSTGQAKLDRDMIIAPDFGIKEDIKDEVSNPTTPGAVKTVYKGSDFAAYHVEGLKDSQIRVTVLSTDGATLYGRDVKLGVPVWGTVKSGTPKLTVDGEDSFASSSVHLLTGEEVTGSNKLGISVADPTNIPVDGGELAAITVTERIENALDTTKENRTITLTLPNSSDLIFSSKFDSINLDGERAFAPAENVAPEEVYYSVDKKGNKNLKEINIVLPDNSKVDTTTGKWIVEGVKVEPEDRRQDASTGDVEVTISGKMVEKKSYVAAKVGEFDVALTAKEVVNLVAGKGSKEVTLTLQENVKESLDDKRWAYFELSEGAFIKVDEKALANVTPDKDGNYVVSTVDDLKTEEIITVKVNGNKVADHTDMLDVVTDKNGNVKGFRVQFEYTNKQDEVDKNKGHLDPNKANKIEFVFNVQATTPTTGDVTMTVDSKAFEHEAVQVAKVTAPVEVSFQETTVKVGLENQALGNITIKETDKAMLQKGELVITLDENVRFITKAKDLKVKVSDGSTLQVEVDEVNKDSIVLNVLRESKEASSFTIEGIVADVDRTVPEGKVAVEVFGDSLRQFDGVWGNDSSREDDGHYGKGFVYEDNEEEEFRDNKSAVKPEHAIITDGYLIVGTKNTEDITTASKAKEIILTVNSTNYTVNGEAKTADAAAFIDANNRTMVPVKFVAEEFGKIEFGTINGVGTVTVYKDADVLQFQNGSNIMNKNGIAIPMDTKTVIKDGRTYVPFKYVAQGLGINFSFDDATKSITFTNQAK